eukprot:14182192-Alexandrium_andersonii.AAC.1
MQAHSGAAPWGAVWMGPAGEGVGTFAGVEQSVLAQQHELSIQMGDPEHDVRIALWQLFDGVRGETPLCPEIVVPGVAGSPPVEPN